MKYIQHVCKSNNHYCPECGKKIQYGAEEWELKWYKNGRWGSEWYHPWCC